jgi:hypothetical protein
MKSTKEERPYESFTGHRVIVRRWSDRKSLGDFCASTFFAGFPMLEESLSRFECERPRTTRLVVNRNRPAQR